MKNLFCKLLFLAIALNIQYTLNSQSLELYGNYHTMGVIIALDENDDPENDAVATIKYRVVDSIFREGFPATRTNSTQFVGSLFWLKPNTNYEVIVTIQDPTSAGLDGTVLTSIAKTRKNPELYNSIKSYYVSPTGSGTLFGKSSPGSIEDAVKLVNAGEEIVMYGGVYHTGKLVFAYQGSKDAPITIRSIQGERAILDGSDTLKHTWINEGQGIYSTELDYKNTRLIIADRRRLYQYKSMDNLNNLTWDLDGFFVDEKKVYVKIRGKNPADLDMIISKEHNAITLWEKDYFHIRNLTFRYFGQGDWAKAIYFYSSSHNVVDSCLFAMNNLGVGIKYNSNQITVQNSEFYDDTDMWDWNAMKASIVENTLLSFYDPVSGRGHVIRNNIFHDCQDGMAPGSFYQNELTTELDIYNNTIYNAGDDGISVDGWASNVRVWNNKIYDVLVGISFAPINKGPAYAIRNLIYNTGYGNSIYRGMSFKFNSGYDKSGKMYLFHNTSDALLEGIDGFECKIPGDWELIYSRNNAFTGNRFAISYLEGSGDRPLDMDYDNLYTSDESKFAYWYDNQSHNYSTLNEFQSETGLEQNGIASKPGFLSSATGDYSLAKESPLIDKAVFIPGINDGFYGDSPDIGAFEWRAPLGVINDEKSGIIIYPNPASSFLNIVLDNNNTKINSVDIYTISGKKIISKENTESNNLRCNIEELPEGIYIIKISLNNGENYFKKVVVN